MTQPATGSVAPTGQSPFLRSQSAIHGGQHTQTYASTTCGAWTKVFSVVFLPFVVLLISVQPAFAVVGGATATLNQRNWMVGVAMADVADGYIAQFCGGVLLSPNWVITAAHCTFDENKKPYDANDLHVLVNRLQLSSHDGQRIQVIRIVRHPGFDMNALNDDLALLELAHNADAPAIALGNLEEFEAQRATVFGWGVTEDGHAVDWLRQAELPLVSQFACNIIYKPYGFTITNNMLCAGNVLGGVDACTGDSGGPLVVFDNSRSDWVLVGIVSWGAGCGASGAYGVYTRVSAYGAWIAEKSGIIDLE